MPLVLYRLILYCTHCGLEVPIIRLWGDTNRVDFIEVIEISRLHDGHCGLVQWDLRLIEDKK